jgi:GH15 family glucan-1,4-alpha-glucosidase
VYQRIEDYGVIGNTRTVALVSTRGSIDWLCLPNFDSPSVFAALLDDQKGGRFSIGPACDRLTCKQLYWPDTNVLITRFLSEDGVAEMTDFMPCCLAPVPDEIVRSVSAVHGEVTFDLVCEPACDYARAAGETTVTAHGAVFRAPGIELTLSSHVPLEATARGVRARFVLREGDRTTFVLRRCEGGTCALAPSDEESRQAFVDTVRYWRNWLKKGSYRGRWREMVNRSALVLKLLTFEPTGAIVAAPTCSLPERIGGVRNWDYRYTWVRDAAFTLYAFLRIGFTDEARRFMEWLGSLCRCKSGAPQPLQIVYGIDGRTDLTESTLDHLEGYRGSRPVHLGNGAFQQLQLDIYGELMDSVYLYNKYGMPISFDLWTHLRKHIDWLCDNWRRDDAGIWETRGDPTQFVYSKLMSWVAVDRGLRLADKRSFPADRARWLAERDSIYLDIMARGWSERRKAFVQSYGSGALDASNLLMPLVFFVSPVDPKMLDTLSAIMRAPREGGLLSDSLVYRYDLARTADGLPGEEGTFNMCTFWLVEALTRAGRGDRERLEQARLLFERMLGYANHLGLYAEQTSRTGEALGNYPQALTHLALISAAFNLDRTLNEVGG